MAAALPAPPTASRTAAAPRAGALVQVQPVAQGMRPPPPRRSAVLDRIKAEAAGDAETLYGTAAAVGLGLMDRYGINYPHLPMLDKTATPAIALYAAAKFFGSSRLRAVARGAVHVAAYRMAAGDALAQGVSGDDGEDLTAGSI